MAKKDILAAPGTDLQIQIDGSDFRLKSRLIGIDRDRFVVIRPPSNLNQGGPLVSRMAPGSNITVRYVQDGTIWGFRSKVIQLLTGAIPAVFISYPDHVENVDLRSCKRFESRIPAEAAWDGRHVAGLIADLSQAGAKFIFKNVASLTVPTFESEIQLKIPLLAGAQDPGLTAQVRSQSEDRSRVVLGLQFQTLDPPVRSAIDSYVASLEEIVEP